MTIDLSDSREVCDLIIALTQEENSSVEIFAPNADFDGPNSAISVSDGLGNRDKYFGVSVLDCLRKAARVR